VSRVTPDVNEVETAPRASRRLVIDDETLLTYVREERRRSIGFGEGDGGELTERRERALNYYKGDVTQDLENVDKRSKAVSTDVAEAVDTAIPDLAEIFLCGEDIISFAPEGEDDEAQAQDETDFIRKALFQQNPGFVIFTTAFKDALLLTTGLFHWWWEESLQTRDLGELAPAQAELAPAVKAQLEAAAGAPGQVVAETRADGSVAFSLPQLRGRVCYRAIPPEDFTVAQDTVTLAEATYCAWRERARAQALIERGFDAEAVRALPGYARPNQAVDFARDEAGETSRGAEGAGGDLRMVEIRHHYIRVDRDGDGETELWCVHTDSEDARLLKVEPVDHVPFAALTPYMSAHRFYGESVADRLLEIQRIKTTLLRMMLDSGYFALNQRMEVAMEAANEFTIPDLLRNEPNMPVRSNTGGAVRPLQAGQLGFDVFGALEYASTMAEQRTGIVRNAQGLNPDTLHDTAAGAMQLIGAAQKRLRFIARVFAETGIKELCLGLHRTLRVNWSDQHAALKGKFGRSWKSARPHRWPEREDMDVHVGPVSKDHELAVLSRQLQIVQEVIGLQGGLAGPFVTAGNVHNLLTAWSRAAGQKAPELYWTDPKALTPQQQLALGQAHARPDPALAEAQGRLRLAQAKAAGDLQLERAKAAARAQAEAAAAGHAQALKREQLAAELALKREALAADLQLRRDVAALEAEHRRRERLAGVAGPGVAGEIRLGGEPG
jgi:hypothetical protein